jgi:hypothetical protein
MVIEGSARTRRSLARRGRPGATLDCPAVHRLIASVATLAAVPGATAAAPAGARTARRPAIVLPTLPPGQTSITLPGGLDFFDSLGAFLRRRFAIGE